MLRCVFTSLAASALKGRLERRAPDGEWRPPESPVVPRMTRASGQTQWLDPQRVGRDGVDRTGDFALFLPRGLGPMRLDLFADGVGLALSLDGGLGDDLTRAADDAAFIAAGLSESRADAAAAELTGLCLATEAFWAARTLDAPFDRRNRLQTLFDETADAAPLGGALTLLDYAHRFGPTEFLFEKTSLILLRRDAARPALAVADAGLDRHPASLGLRLHRAIALERLGALDAAVSAHVHAATLADRVDWLTAAGRAAYRLGHGDFGVRPEAPGRIDQAIGLLRAAAHADETGEAAYLAGAALAAERRLDAATETLSQALETATGPRAAALLVEIAILRRAFDDAARRLTMLGSDADRLRGALRRATAFHLGRIDDPWTPAPPTDVAPLALHHAGRVEPSAAERADLPADAPRRTWRANAAAAPIAPAASPTGAAVVLISPKGAYPFGGAERFLLAAADVYASQGFAPVFVGTEPPAEDYAFRWPTRFVAPTVEAVRDACLAERPAFVHAVSGAIALTADALRGLDLPLVKGLHYWSELFRPRFLAEGTGYPPGAMDPIDPAEALALLGAGPLYVNSPLLRDLVAERLGVVPPVVPSVEPDPAPKSRPSSGAERYALSLDARASKGGFFTLEIAKRAPQRLFVLVAPQGGRAAIDAAVEAQGLRNVAVLDRVERIDDLIADAAVVLTPSFEFVETFGRVPIEAALRGRPSIVADVGNLPSLISDESCVLGPDPAAWATRVERFFTEPPPPIAPPAWCSPERAAAQLARLAPMALQNAALLAAPHPGDAAGPFERLWPALEMIAAHLGAPIDLIVTDQIEAARAAAEGRDSVASVLRRDRLVDAKPYRLVVIGPGAPKDVAPFADMILHLDAPAEVDADRLVAIMQARLSGRSSAATAAS